MEHWINHSYEPGLVSVVIPCHNQECFLPACLQSLLAQDYRPLEIIVVDDGSTDASAEVVKTFQKKQRNGLAVKYLYQSNQGAPYARNCGCRQANGEFIQFLDGDDVLFKDKILPQVDLFKELRDADVVYGDGQYLIDCLGFKAKKGRIISIGYSSDMVASLLFGAWVPSFSYLSRRSAVQRCGPWDTSLQVSQDFEYFLRMAIKGCRFHYLRGVTGLYRKHSDNTISEKSLSLNGWTKQGILARAERMLSEKSELTENRIRAIAENYRRIARQLYATDRECFRNSIQNILRLCPQYMPKSRKALLISSMIGFRNYEIFAAIISHLIYKTKKDWF